MGTSEKLSPLLVGSSLAITVAIGYTLCAAAWFIWNEAALNFVNALFHGLDFRKIVSPGSDNGMGSYFYPLAVLSSWAFLMGALFAFISNLLRWRQASTRELSY